MATAGNNSSKKRRRLTVPERYQVLLDVVSGAGSQRDIAYKWRIDRTTGTDHSATITTDRSRARYDQSRHRHAST